MMNQNKWLVIPTPRPAARIILLCFPFAGGSSHSFRGWAPILPPSVELRAVELPGHGTRLSEPLAEDIHELIEPIARGIASSLDKPFAIFGHSMGALLGFEVALYLQNKLNKRAEHLFVSGHGAPGTPRHEPEIHHLPKPQFLAKIKEYNGTPKEALENKELMDLMFPILKADFKICETYAHKNSGLLNTPLTALGGIQDPSTPREDLEKWRSFTTQSFNIRLFPGDHFYLLQQKVNLLKAILTDISSHFNLANT
ncbi:thioesterase II family protein [Caldithrix abyssi]|uniref:Medium-chain acyl-(Acyl-carrier-protein) hydrolase n=2 Tax=Caldithrix abyssi DSM 13497 TaxID=880073 RepID=A0A1J1C6V0_CALAY|nr:alpha/beta fold hydrolase [Caldithrix abyssi]APF18132.1 medium-chain acyl-(acyl-carrier-protein) hydrolase [Caldithrix abyssi DSM 13497]